MSLANAARAGFLTLALCWACSAFAQIAVPPLTARVTDQTATLTSEQKASLEQTLQAFEASKGSQISVLIVPTTGTEPIEQFALRVGESWKLGRKKVDDGALLIIAKDDRNMRIEVGYGLEGALNDATSKRIISEVITPQFKAGDYYRGISDGVASMIKVVSGEVLPAPAKASPNRSQGMDLGSLLPLIFMGTVVIGGIMRKLFGRLPGSVLAGAATGFLAWMFVGAISIALIAGVVAAAFTLFGGGLGSMLGRGGGFGGFGGGGGGFGGGGGGGFSGGGGSFGGGGASGRW
jgi:uncharacterized protein